MNIYKKNKSLIFIPWMLKVIVMDFAPNPLSVTVHNFIYFLVLNQRRLIIYIILTALCYFQPKISSAWVLLNKFHIHTRRHFYNFN